MPRYHAAEVFTPSDFPSLTYVAREEEKLERRLREALATPGDVISISGPSKSGKTVLVEKVVGRDALITVTGAGIASPDHLWDRVLDWMKAPDTTATETSRGVEGEASLRAGGELSIPLVAKTDIDATLTASATHSTGEQATTGRRGLQEVVEEIADSDFVLLIDDYHYMDRIVQVEVAKQIKEAARLHMKICAASVPHRADDVVRSNPELRGRVRAIDIDYWSPQQLLEIARLGYPLLNVEVDETALATFAREASGSPQLMQAICLEACFAQGIQETLKTPTALSLEPARVREILQETSTRTDYSSLVKNMHTGPKTRGTERKEFTFRDRTKGDVYRAVLLAVASDPPCLSFTYNELSDRLRAVCTSELPQPASVYQACAQVSRMALDMYPSQRVIEWDDDFSILDVIDPYFLFYLRWSPRLEVLARS